MSTSAGDFPADFVVLAAGLGAPELAQSVGADVPLMHKPGTVNFVLRAPPDKKLLRKIVVTGAALLPCDAVLIRAASLLLLLLLLLLLSCSSNVCAFKLPGGFSAYV